MRWRSVRARRSVGQGYVQAGLLSREIREFGVPTLSNWVEGNIVGGVIASRRRTPRGRRTMGMYGIFMRENREIRAPG